MEDHFECDECCEMEIGLPDNINGKGKYCGRCIRKMFRSDIDDASLGADVNE